MYKKIKNWVKQKQYINIIYYMIDNIAKKVFLREFSLVIRFH